MTKETIFKVTEALIADGKLTTAEFNDAREALQKQITQKPFVNYVPDFLGKFHYDMKPGHAVAQCPACKTRLRLSKSRDSYCWKCGQALKWEEEQS